MNFENTQEGREILKSGAGEPFISAILTVWGEAEEASETQESDATEASEIE